MKKGFTLLELLVVISIIGILISVTAVTYSSITKNARDARRKTDLEEIRSAIELYRSDNGEYPNITPGASCCGATTIYIEKVPQDPLSNSQSYYYNLEDEGISYTLGAALEGGGTNCTGNPSCGDEVICNYCLGPYGPKQ